jgi:hypothetical protein
VLVRSVLLELSLIGKGTQLRAIVPPVGPEPSLISLATLLQAIALPVELVNIRFSKEQMQTPARTVRQERFRHHKASLTRVNAPPANLESIQQQLAKFLQIVVNFAQRFQVHLQKAEVLVNASVSMDIPA